MKRMTAKRADGRWAIANNDGATNREQLEKFPIAINRLATYEDTGLEPEEIVALLDPPNPPLTLEELRAMDGEPVWGSPVKENGKIPARWMLVSGYNQNKDIYLFAPSCNITQGYDGTSYGKTWLAYRRKPEDTNA